MPKGISLHIGVNKYDVKKYLSSGSLLKRLPNCDADAKAKLAIAQRFGFDSKILLNSEATARNLLVCIEFASANLGHGDIFFLSFSGHGCRAEDRNGDEDDGYDEGWCLYDRVVLDDELFECWKQFRPGVRVLIIADSCHSGTSVKDTDDGLSRPGGQFPVEKTSEVQASCLLLAACQDKEKAFAGGNIHNSLYTYWMLKILEQYDFCDSYRELHNRVLNHMPAASKPNLFTFGPGSERFMRSKPFKI